MDIDSNQVGLDEVNQLIETCARRVVELRMAVPAIFFLELNKPLSALAHAGGIVGMPVLMPVFGAKNYHRLIGFLKDRAHIERLITCIERFELNRRGQADGGR